MDDFMRGLVEEFTFPSVAEWMKWRDEMYASRFREEAEEYKNRRRSYGNVALRNSPDVPMLRHNVQGMCSDSPRDSQVSCYE